MPKSMLGRVAVYSPASQQEFSLSEDETSLSCTQSVFVVVVVAAAVAAVAATGAVSTVSAAVSRIVTGHSRGVAPSLQGWKHRCWNEENE